MEPPNPTEDVLDTVTLGEEGDRATHPAGTGLTPLNYHGPTQEPGAFLGQHTSQRAPAGLQ